jgi:glycosyltransferase involved in cell wall biosynthesis
MGLKKKVLLFENSAKDFISARLSLAKYLTGKGYVVYAFVPFDDNLRGIEDAGILVRTYSFNRKNKGILQILKISIQLYRLLGKENIDIVHSFRFHPNIINNLVGLFSKSKRISHVTGLGISFSINDTKYKILGFISQLVYAFIFLLSDLVIFQNDDDEKGLFICKYYKNKIRVIYGSGIDLEYYSNQNKINYLRKDYHLPETDLIFLITTRLIKEKGIFELVAAFERLILKFPFVRLIVLGGRDKDNPRSIDTAYCDKYLEGRIQFVGEVKDVRAYLEISDFYIYPSYYREGVPRGILEAMAMELPIITTNMPGCKNTVINFFNGLMIRPKNVDSIYNACERMIHNKGSERLGRNSRFLVEKYFANNVVFQQVEKLYR